MSFEEKMKQDLKKDLEIPEIVEQKIQDAYKEIGQGKLRMKKPDNRNQKRFFIPIRYWRRISR